MSNILANNINPRSGNKITIGNVNTTVAIAGTATYEDVTSIDSVGIITARSGVNVTGGQLNVGSNIKIGNAGVITATSFSGDGSALTGIGGTANVSTNTLSVSGVSTFNEDIKLRDGKDIFFFDSSEQSTGRIFAGSPAGVYMSAIRGILNFSNQSTTGTNAGQIKLNCHSSNSIEQQVGGTTKLQVNGSGIDVTGIVTATSFSGDGSQLTGISAGVSTANVSTNTLSVSGVSTFANAATFNDIPTATSIPSADACHIYAYQDELRLSAGSQLQFYSDGFTRWTITSSGALETHGTTYYNLGNSSDSGGRVGNGYFQTSVDLIDNGELRLGTGDDLKLYHNGTDSYINNATGNLIFITDGTERLRISSNGDVTTTGAVYARANPGFTARSGDSVSITRDNGTPLEINRTSSDGNLINLFQAGSIEGTVTVSGSTVSYNGGHLSRWSQLAGGAARTEILRGSVLSNLNEMCEWGDEDNEQLNRMKVSDVEGDKNVAGVFQSWDDDDDTYLNDFYCAMTGDFVIRIAQGVTVERGDLLISAGDGTAKPQDDDIVRSKTIAKVTSTTVSTTYSDGSYCVPCVLMAC